MASSSNTYSRPTGQLDPITTLERRCRSSRECRIQDRAIHPELSAVTLTTFRDIPWNAPLYARLGFRELSTDRLSPVLAALVREEAERGLESARRVVMSFEISAIQVEHSDV